MKDKNQSPISHKFISTLLLVFILMGLMLTGIFFTFYNSAYSKIHELGISNMKAQAARVDNYINKGMDVLWVTADTVNNMMDNGKSNEEILQYLEVESLHQKSRIDENFTGIYGYIRGEYLDGVGWVPPEDYDPTTREWYVAAQNSDYSPVIVAPYLDAQTDRIMISVSMLLSDGVSVVSLDIALNEVQSIARDLTLEDKGYGFIMDNTGLVIAHFYAGEKGKVYPVDESQVDMIDGIMSLENSSFETDIDGEKCTVFSTQIQDDWFVVIVVNNSVLFHELQSQLTIGIAISVVVFMVVVLFCIFAYRSIVQYQNQENASRKKLEQMNTNVVRALAYTIDAKDRYTSGHSRRVAEYSQAIAKRMGKSEEFQNTIYIAGLLHDIGKIRVPEEVINKTGKLDEQEFDQIRIHPVSGYHILKDIHEDDSIAFGAKYHHERFDGNGYPNGFAGENIPEVARIIGVADSYDAMASNRSYRKALPQEVVRAEIEKGSGKQFDPEVAKVMLEMIDEDKDYTMCEKPKSIKNILVIDDDDFSIKLVSHLFQDVPGYHVYCASNVEEMNKILNEVTIHLILLDLKMPDINGFDLYPQIREKYHVPIVLMTSDKKKDTIDMANKLGMDDYISKPFKPSVFLETVRGIINNWHDEE